jgi:tetratricopeptide (TPR) repeat protein
VAVCNVSSVLRTVQFPLKKSLKRQLANAFAAAAAAFVLLGSAVGQAGGAGDLSPETVAVRDRAFAELRAGRWQDAESLFEDISGPAAKDPLSLYGWALARFNVGKPSEADALLAKAIPLLETDENEKGLLADCLVLSAIVSARSGDNSDAVPKLRRAVELVPGHFDAVLSLARALFGNGDVPGSAVYFRKAVELRPNDLRARFFLATALENLGATDEALKEYRAIVSANPDDVNGNLGLGVLLIKTDGDRSEEGLKALRKVIELDGSNYEARITLGKALVRRKQFEEAVVNLESAAKAAPGNPEPFYQLALAYKRLGKNAESEKAMEKVRAIHQARRGVPEDQ